ncbi:AurF N-oxygenase family protein [Aeromicrobium stalagmiti]|uniref:AurF N-oxygenase family protein n=1 Tax=Aeromicrobium stalagmiti TaxID=2738988 RepID=UPI00156921D8|nr:diiron oxygenase [Aeromicrobium stalagmiti]NRQ49260.1 diiron oxygenase [Aeromicrobium stalagmiti]
MTVTADEFRTTIDPDDALARLLESSQKLSYDPQTEVDWDTPLDPTHFGLNPEWSTLYGTDLWDEMTPEQRVTLTRHEVGSIMSTGIWFEMILQQMLLREQYTADVTGSEFQFALTEIADECRHSLMFARACSAMGVPHYVPSRPVVEAARGLKSVAKAEVAYGAILVAEEILDVMQRDWMRGENVLPIVRTTSKIHVVEEARHMKFARHEIREHLEGSSALRRRQSAWVISTAAYVIVKSMVNPAVYEAAGLDKKRALEAAKSNEHHHNLMRLSCVHLMDFLSEVGLLTPAAMRRYRAVHML